MRNFNFGIISPLRNIAIEIEILYYAMKNLIAMAIGTMATMDIGRDV